MEMIMSLSKETILRIESLTYDLVREIYTDSEEVAPPINLDKVIKQSGLSVKIGAFDDPDIIGMYDRKQSAILLQEGDNLVRKLFTAAHELGHYYLHADKPNETFFRKDFFLLDDSDKIQEQEANWFAASLLMPREIFAVFYKKLSNIEQLAKLFNVSSTAVYFRIKNLKNLGWL
jgi:Zn-dependent peptidase ImmA (M78 family)